MNKDTRYPGDLISGEADEDEDRNEYGYPMNQPRYRDPYAMSIAIFGVIVQAGGFLWFGGQLTQRVAHSEDSIKMLQSDSGTNAKQDSQIAVLSAQLTDIRLSVQSIDRKLEQR